MALSVVDGLSLKDVFMFYPSVAFIRHPFSRLVSGYLERIVLERQVSGSLPLVSIPGSVSGGFATR